MSDRLFKFALEKHVNKKLATFQLIAGGCINQAALLQTPDTAYCIKWNRLSAIDLFEKERLGLSLLQSHSHLQIPAVLGHGAFERQSYLLLAYVEPSSLAPDFWNRFGIALAEMHQTSHEYFGLDHDNYIGRLHQSNKQHANWHTFFIEERLKPQIKLAKENRLIDTSTEKKFNLLFQKLEELVPKEPPAFLHGDLWSGNFLVGPKGMPALIDPAVHFGHRETELAFTRLFGGFDASLYDAYHEAFPLASGFEERIEIHNLYPLLVHVNLFGASYLSGIHQTLKRFT